MMIDARLFRTLLTTVALALVAGFTASASAAPPRPASTAQSAAPKGSHPGIRGAVAGASVARWGIRAYSGSSADLRRLQAHQAAYRKARNERNFKALAKLDSRFIELMGAVRVSDAGAARRVGALLKEFRGLSGDVGSRALARKQTIIEAVITITEGLAG